MGKMGTRMLYLMVGVLILVASARAALAASRNRNMVQVPR